MSDTHVGCWDVSTAMPMRGLAGTDRLWTPSRPTTHRPIDLSPPSQPSPLEGEGVDGSPAP